MRARLVVLLAVAVLVAGCTHPSTPPTRTQRAIDYLEGLQNPDGGYATREGGASDVSTTAWVALAMASGRGDATTVARLVAYLEAQAGNVSRNATGSMSPTNALALHQLASVTLGRAEATDGLLRVRLRAAANDSSLNLNEHVFVLGTLARMGVAGPDHALVATVRDQFANPTEQGWDGWFQANTVLALVAAGHGDAELYQGLSWIWLDLQRTGPGFSRTPEEPADASTTSAIVAALRHLDAQTLARTSAEDYLESLQQEDGSVRFSESVDFARTKTTAEAVLAWTGAGPFAA